MNMYLMRHAIAVSTDREIDDSQRPLTEIGRNKLIHIARNLKRMGVKFDFIITSPYLRARQTAEIVAHVLEIKPKHIHDSENLTPLGFADRLIDEINAMGDIKNLLLVGHEPFLSQLIGVLVAGDASIDIGMKKAGVCRISLQQLTHERCATLKWLLPPAIFAEE